MESYHYLALAVVRQAVQDAEAGTKEQKADARQCILAGGLDRWICMLSDQEQTYCAVRTQLQRLAADAGVYEPDRGTQHNAGGTRRAAGVSKRKELR